MHEPPTGWQRHSVPEPRRLGHLEGPPHPQLTGVEIAAPTDDELAAWLRVEIPRSEAHRRAVVDDYWEGSWRRAHTGDGVHPDDHLWRAAWAVQSMRDALEELI